MPNGERVLKTIFTICLVSVILWLTDRPARNGDELARRAVEACYSTGASDLGTDCVMGLGDLRSANDTFGTLRNYRIVAVKTPFIGIHYTVLVDAERSRGSTRETVSVSAGHENRTDRDFASIDGVDIVSR